MWEYEPDPVSLNKMAALNQRTRLIWAFVSEWVRQDVSAIAMTTHWDHLQLNRESKLHFARAFFPCRLYNLQTCGPLPVRMTACGWWLIRAEWEGWVRNGAGSKISPHYREWGTRMGMGLPVIQQQTFPPPQHWSHAVCEKGLWVYCKGRIFYHYSPTFSALTLRDSGCSLGPSSQRSLSWVCPCTKIKEVNSKHSSVQKSFSELGCLFLRRTTDESSPCVPVGSL